MPDDLKSSNILVWVFIRHGITFCVWEKKEKSGVHLLAEEQNFVGNSQSSRPSGLAQAIMEVVRVNKTLYILNYIDDEDYRWRILAQLNWGKGHHAVTRAICYGQRGEIRKRYHERQKDQLGTLGQVTNAVVLWNTFYMQEVLSWIRRNGEEIINEDIARLSPLMHGHINMLSHYTFTLSEDILKKELRALNLNINNALSS